MYLTKHMKGYIYIFVITIIIILAVLMLVQNISAPPISNIGQALLQQPETESEPKTTTMPDNHGDAVEQTSDAEDTTELTAPATANMQQNIFMFIIIILAAAAGAGIFFLTPIVKNHFKVNVHDTLFGRLGKGKEFLVDVAKVEEASDDLHDVDNDSNEVIYEEGRGYRFRPPPAIVNIDEPDNEAGRGEAAEPEPDNEQVIVDESEQEEPTASEPDDDPDVMNEFDLIEANEPEQDSEPGTMNELELCWEIERLTVKANQRAMYIRKLGNEPGFVEFPEITQIEEYDELPPEVSELEQEVMRLKNKANLQIDYIEKIHKKQEAAPPKEDNNSEKPEFLQCVANVLCNIEVLKPKRNQEFVYVPISDFFNNLSQRLPDYNKNNAIEALIQHGVIDNKKYDTVYNKTRVLKVNSKQFEALTTEITYDAGA